jgi:hypothetical protein
MSSAKIDRPLNAACITRRKSSRHEQIGVWHMSGRMWSSHKQIDVEVDGIGPSLGQQVRNHALSKINSGEWPEGYRIPSESRLVEQFNA